MVPYWAFSVIIVWEFRCLKCGWLYIFNLYKYFDSIYDEVICDKTGVIFS